MSDSLRPHELQHARLPCPSLSSRVCSNSCPSSGWCHPTISSSDAPFPLPSIISSIRVFSSELAFHIRWSEDWSFSFSNSLSTNIQGWFHLVLTGLISLQSKGLLRVFASTTVWRHWFFGAQPSLWFNSHIHTWLQDNWKDRSFDYTDLC